MEGLRFEARCHLAKEIGQSGAVRFYMAHIL
jgi:hypothetical protein